MAVNRNMLNGAFINIQSVGNKTNDIRELINQEQLDFLRWLKHGLVNMTVLKFKK